MADTLKSIVTFTAVAPSGVVSAPHHLNIRSAALVPDQVTLRTAGIFQVLDADSITVTVTNLGLVEADCECLVEAWHPVDRLFGNSGQDGSFTNRLGPGPFAPPSTGAANPTEQFAVTNNAGVPILAGSPVTALGVRGDASSGATAPVVGLAITTTAPTMPTPLQIVGALVLTTAQWDAVTGSSGGLVAGALYTLAPSPGQLSTSPPTTPGQSVVALGTARDANTLIILLALPVLLH
jgi:hypothetical protein